MIAIHRYELVPRGALNAHAGAGRRKGALLRVGDGPFGYADLFAWSELGDLPLETQLAELARGSVTAQVERSLELARFDREARTKRESVFSAWPSGPWPRNHFLITSGNSSRDELQEAARTGFRTVKLKAGGSVEREVARLRAFFEILPPEMRVRVDFNAALDLSRFERLVSELGSLGSRIEFFEDPIAWDPKLWASLRAKGVRLGLDRGAAELVSELGTDLLRESVDVLVLKSAYAGVDVERLREVGLPVVVTSNLDHPLGQLGALYHARLWAAGSIPILDCGLLSHTAYEPTAFSTRLQVQGPELQAMPGPGFGFGELLEALPWENLE